MRQATPRSPVQRIAAGLLFAALCVPAPVWAADEPGEEVSDEPPAPIETHWYDRAGHELDIVVDLLVIRPCAFVTAAVGAALFVPAVILTAPNGKDSMAEAYDRFVREPGEYFASRPLGEF